MRIKQTAFVKGETDCEDGKVRKCRINRKRGRGREGIVE